MSDSGEALERTGDTSDRDARSDPKMVTPADDVSGEQATGTIKLTFWRSLDPVIVACVLWLLAFPIVAALVASGEPLSVPADSAGPRVALTRSTVSVHAQVQAVPVFLDGTPSRAALTDPTAMRHALLAAASQLLGTKPADALVHLATRQKSVRAGGENFQRAQASVPLRYPMVERILNRYLPDPLSPGATAETNDLGALLIEAAALPPGSNYLEPFPQSGAVAVAVLDRAQALGGCAPRLNLGFLLSTDQVPRNGEVKLELERAASNCPGDPTPLWLLGEYQSERAGISIYYPDATFTQVNFETNAPFATFATLRRRFPHSAAGWAGAGDANLRLAYQTATQQPFTTQAYFRRALTFYLAAQRVEANPEIAAGAARAYVGLQDFSAAVTAQRAAVAGRSHDAPLQARLVEYLEQGHAYAQAVTAAQPLTVEPHFPVGTGYMMQTFSLGDMPGGLYLQEANGPLSIGADRFKPIELNLDDESGGAGGGENDLAFIPAYRETMGVTGYSRWCPQWSMRRDEILARRPAEALMTLPSPETKNIQEGSQGLQCGSSSDLLAAIAAYEAGQHQRATQFVELEHNTGDTRAPLARLDDARQNLWRFAGDLPRASVAAREWRVAAPEEALAFDDSGEIEFLAGRYSEAARLFGQAAWLARAATALPTIIEAEASLKRGVALARLGRENEALRTLEEANVTAEDAEGVTSHAQLGDEYSESTNTGAFLSYYALCQIGYQDLSAHRFGLAAEAYEAALQRTRTLGTGPELAQERTDPYTAAYDDLSLAQAQIGHLHEALASARLAVSADPLGPLALATEGYALARLGRYREASASLHTAVGQLPSQFSAWNDLGYVEDRLGHRGAAVTDFRRAIGVSSTYGLGWFNLGVALEQQGLLHALGAQGAFGRAIAAEPSLRNRSHRLSLDNNVYLTDLDLSKPLPPNWSFTTTQKRPLVGSLGLVLALIAALQLGRALATGQGIGSKAAEWLLQAARALLRHLPGRDALAPARLAVAACLLVFLLPLLRAGNVNPVEVVLLLLGVAAIVATIWRARVLVARREGIALRQEGWSPAIVFSLGAAALGFAWAPLPVASTDTDAPSVHWIGPIVSTALACALLIPSVLLEVPIARTLAGTALVMAASMLIPVKPLDGGVVTQGKAGTGASLALLGGGLFLLLGLW